MARTSFLQNSFLGGEYAPFYQGRSNAPEYYQALNLCLNYLPTDEGALTRRPGFRFSAEARHPTAVRIIPFATSDGDTFVCEFTPGVLRLHTGGRLRTLAPRDVANISSANPAVVETASAHGLTTGDTVVFPTIGPDFGQHLFNRQFRVTVLSTTTFSLANTGTRGTAPTDGAAFAGLNLFNETVAKVQEIVTPYTTAEQLADLRFAEEADTLFLFHRDFSPRLLSAPAFTLTAPTLAHTYLPQTSSTTLAFSALTGSITVTASSTAGINGGQGFLATDVGRQIQANTGTTDAPNFVAMTITAVGSPTSVTATVFTVNLTSTAATTQWALQAFSNTTGWPTHGVVHESRLWVVSDAYPGRIDATQVFGYPPQDTILNFDLFSDSQGTVADDDGISATVAGSGRKNFQWLLSVESGLLAGADGGEWLFRASALDDPLTPFTVQARQVTTFGSADVQPFRAGRNTLFAQSIARGLIEHRLDTGGYDGNDLARQARHLTSPGLAELAYSQVPTPVLWARRNDRRLIGLTYRDDLEGRQVAWHQHNVAWADDAMAISEGRHVFLAPEGPVLSIAVAPFSDVERTRNDTLWAAVLRNGWACVEYLTPVFDEERLPNEAFFVDSGTAYKFEETGFSFENVSNDTYRFYGLDRLVGDTVDGVWRGEDLGTAVVQAGGFAEFRVNAGLQGAASAYETTSTTDFSTSSFGGTPLLVRHITDGTGTAELASPPPNSAFLTGEDGKRYFIERSNANPLTLYNVTDGASGPSRSFATILADVIAAGVRPSGGYLGTGGASRAPFIVPGTQYLVYVGGTAFGVRADKFAAYYKVDATGALVLVGGLAVSVDTLATQFSPPGNAEAYSMAGHLFTVPFGDTSNYALAYPLLVAYHGESRSSFLALPSVNEVLATTPIVQAGSGAWLNRELDLATVGLTDVLNVNGYTVDNTSRGFFLPAANTAAGTRAYFVWHPADIAEHSLGVASPAAPFLTTNSPGREAGFISSVKVAGQDTAAIAAGSVEVSANARFQGVAYPFPDMGENFAGGASTILTNFYLPASVFPTDPADVFSPWWCFFPRVYNDPGDGDKLGVRTFLYDPTLGVFTHVGFAKAQLFDFGTSGVDANFEPRYVSFYWDRTTNELTALMGGDAGSPITTTVVARFGTFTDVGLEAVEPSASHVDGVVGLNYSSRAQILRPDLNSGAQAGTGAGKLRRTDRFNGFFYRTGQIRFGTSFTNLIEVVLSDPDSLGRRPLFSGITPIRSLQDTYGYDSMMAWEQARPQPGGIVGVVGHIQTQDL